MNHGIAISNKTGAASSAAKVRGKVGVRDHHGIAWHENGQAIKWTTVFDSVARGFRHWRHKMAMRGEMVFDRDEAMHADIKEARAKRAARNSITAAGRLAGAGRLGDRRSQGEGARAHVGGGDTNSQAGVQPQGHGRKVLF